MGELLVEPVHLGDDLRNLFRAVPGTEHASLRLPLCTQLSNNGGGFITYDEYKRKQQLSKADTPYADDWPVLTPDIYDQLIRMYRKNGFTCAEVATK
jgi:hypothetical protein